MDVHPGLLSIIEKMLNEATSPESDSTYVNPRLKNDILDQVREHHMNIMYYNKLMEKMRKKNSLTRDLAFQIVDELVLHSKKVRHLFVQSLPEIVDLAFGIRNAVPEPEYAARDFQIRLSESMEIYDKRFGAMYPQFSVCREYLREKIVLERKNQKRLSASASPSASASSVDTGKQQQRQRKQHSMDILLEAVNKVVWGLFEDMEAFEYKYYEAIQVEEPSPSQDADMLNFDDPFRLGVSLNFRPPEKQKNKSDVIRDIYTAMSQKYETLVNELIPTLERNQSLLQVRNTAKSQRNLEKIERMLARCYSTSQRCTRLIYRGKSMFGEEDMF